MRHIPSESRVFGDSPNGGLRWRAPKARARLRIPIPSRGWHKRSQDRPIGGFSPPNLSAPRRTGSDHRFLLTLGIAAFVDVRERLRQAITKSAEELDLVATVLAERIDRAGARIESGDAVDARLPRASSGSTGRARPRRGRMRPADRRDQHDHRDAARDERLRRPQAQRSDRPRSADRRRHDQPGVSDITLADGSRILLALRDINAPLGQLAITQRRAVVLAEWRADTTLTVTLFSADRLRAC